ncbi:hypothetical protein BV22DRAFT_1109620 [Leucogyrophana mollusca]|uniref:Uncharacterized protein n=1 Tax=Leucogyrophana mollusca TaxID=85980 RepID=A0ACB8BWU6_9AGAM|nr:hypothetical protein BV22DRAFT_1109620 [Leucogyrophana mollusca]
MSSSKEYVDRGVQASTPPPNTRLPDSDLALVLIASGTVPRRASHATLSFNSPSCSPSRSPLSRRESGAYSHSFPLDSPTSPVRATLISRRVPKRKALPYSRPSEANRDEKRVVSMPENVPEYARVPVGTRVVSMPEDLRPAFEPSLESVYSPSTGDSFGSYLEKRNRIHVHPPADVPHTPSPPSSPESVLIIDGDAQLPDAFLRRKYSPELDDYDEGWIAWASSPPRPIPALHGPLSLPYARCPSGAEGTIIDESDNVSRIIWGLGPGELPSGHSRIGTCASSYEACPRVSAHVPISQAPPRLQRKSLHSSSSHNPQVQPHIPTGKQATITETELQEPSFQDQIERKVAVSRLDRSSFPSASTIREDLSKDTDTWRPVYTVRDHPRREHIHQEAQYSRVDEGLLLDWQEMTLDERQLEHTMAQYSESRKSAVPGFPPVTQVQVPQAYPRIFVERRPNEYVASVNTPRQSAMAIAQQYRTHLQQQLRQKQQQLVGLPTPPNSSSPQWSSNFSPYQGSSLSPDMDLPYHSRPSPNISYAPHKQRSDPSHQLRRFVYERMGNLATGVAPQTNTYRSNGPSDSVDKTLKSLSSLSPQSEVSNKLAHYLRHLNALTSQSSFTSPVHPGPPPNTPLPPVPFVTNPISRGSTSHAYGGAVTATPPSPQSPEARTRSVSYQQPQSVPLVRPMQRRLSSVPEEDLSVFIDSSPNSQLARDRRRGLLSRGADALDGHSPAQRPDQQRQFLQVPSASYQSRTPSPEFSIPNREYDPRTYALYHGASPARVRLPYVKAQGDYQQDANDRARAGIGHSESVPSASQQSKRKPRGRKIRGPPGNGFGRGQGRALVPA